MPTFPHLSLIIILGYFSLHGLTFWSSFQQATFLDLVVTRTFPFEEFYNFLSFLFYFPSLAVQFDAYSIICATHFARFLLASFIIFIIILYKTLLSSSPEYGAEIIMDISTAGIDMPMFSALLHYLYTGEFGMEDSRFQNVDILVQLSEEFGTPNSLDVDMRGLFDYMCYYDVVLSFSSDSELVEAFGGNQNCLDEELKAHKAIISARSPFFRNLLQRRIRTGEEITDRTL